MLKSTYWPAKIGANTAENKRDFAQNLPKICNYPTGPLESDGYLGLKEDREASLYAFDKSMRALRSAGFGPQAIADKLTRKKSRRAAAGRAELLANPAIRAQIFAGSIQTPHWLPNFE